MSNRGMKTSKELQLSVLMEGGSPSSSSPCPNGSLIYSPKSELLENVTMNLEKEAEEEPQEEPSTSSAASPPPTNSSPRKTNVSYIVDEEEKIKLNIGGYVHETFLSTLRRPPNTRLGKLAHDLEQDPAYDPSTGMYFFNRNPNIFLSIIQYYRTGELHIDHSICGSAIKNELEYWQIDPNEIEPCCWAQYAKFLENRQTLEMLDSSFQDVAFTDPESDASKCRLLQFRLWRHIEDPSFSLVGKLFAAASIFFVILSIVAYVLETHNFFRVPRFPPALVNGTNDTEISNLTSTIAQKNYVAQDDNDTDNGDFSPSNGRLDENNSTVVWWLSWINLFCFVWFLFEYVFRLSVCPSKKEFFLSILNDLDLLVLLVMAFECAAVILGDLIPRRRYVRALIPLRFARIIRIVKLMKHYRAFKVLIYTIKVSLNELALMIVFLMIGVVIFACLVYYVEPDTFPNIPIGCWWALVTMTTLGYGDYYPRDVGGYFIGGVAAIFGVLTIAFTVPIVVNNFSLYYSHAQTRAKRGGNNSGGKISPIATVNQMASSQQTMFKELGTENSDICKNPNAVIIATLS